MQDTPRGPQVAPEAVGQESPDPTEERRKQEAGRGFPGWLGTAAGVFSVVLLLLVIFLVVIFVVR